MSRISFLQRFENIEQINRNNAEKLDESMRDISSGKKVRKPSDDPTALVNISKFSDRIDNIGQFKKNVQNGRTFLENSEGTIKEVKSNLQRVRELAVQGTSENLTDSDRDKISQEVDQLLGQVVNLANTQIGEKFLFGGAETDLEEQPFKVERNGEGEIIDVSYQGDLTELQKRFGQNEKISVNSLGNEVFQATNQGVEGGFQFDYSGELQKSLNNSVGYEALSDPPPAQQVTAGLPATGPAPPSPDGNKTSLQVSDPGEFSVGETVRVFEEDGSESPGDSGDQDFEKTVITDVNTGAGTVEVDLKNEYDASNNTVIQSDRPDGARQNITGGSTPPGAPVTTFGEDNGILLQINDTSDIEVGDKVKIEDSTTDSSETRIVQAVNDATDEIGVDLSTGPNPENNTYTLNNTTVQKVAEETQPQGEGYFKIDNQKFYYDTSEDSIIDIAKRINKSGIDVEAKFAGPEKFSEQNLKQDVDSGGSKEIRVQDANKFAEGQDVIISDAQDQERVTVESIESNSEREIIQVDNLSNTYNVSDDATIRRANDEGTVEEYSPEEVTGADDGPLKFKLESRNPHQIFLKDFDRQVDNTPDRSEGLLNDLQFLGDGEGNPPPKRDEANFPNPYHDESTVTGKSVFDVMIDLRESLQQNEDSDSGTITVGDNSIGGEAQTRRNFDPFGEETLPESLSETRDAIDSIISHQTKMGARLNRLDSAESRLEDLELNVEEILSGLQDVDLAEAVSKFRRRQNVQQASLRVASQITQQTLANFI